MLFFEGPYLVPSMGAVLRWRDVIIIVDILVHVCHDVLMYFHCSALLIDAIT